MAKNYCRYCSFLCYGDVPFCTLKEQVKTVASIRTPTNCPDFDLSPLGDVESGKMYHPRKERGESALKGQMRIEDMELIEQ